ncbi:6,7-dimethyl-8-ribityllumazine synthase [Thermospira aquatica]|uniref:6,7-dimethyl-8-ribityllumazine synthase n=1 Tax=Thermospira aquatica TaxID=2828656 RepID=A0AAX3BDV8_9SPIR|nr:6,7-dimethyl-8-ribityllumazine synthase [Thermospira aquatica]URA10514.1 6,7-dimethyl-8-ribityllumazine synthase [Thermospira aquatica]
MPIYEGKLTAKGMRLALVVGKFNSFIGDKLVSGALNAFEQLEGDPNAVDIYKVPGSYEIPGVVRRLLEAKKHDAIIALGVIIRGQTPHFEYVSGNTSKALMEMASEGKIPVIFGIITADDVEQAIDRAGVKNGNKGYEAVLTAVEMANLYKQMNHGK